MYGFLKRFFDIVLSLVAIIVFSWLLIIIAVAIVVEDKGNILFKQKRIGKNKKEFYIYKFRTMKVSTPKDVPTHLLDNPESYITKIGGFLRKTSLDELPQLFNVLKGEMSLVGPRPERPELAEKYTEENPEFAMRLKVKAGITGFAQVYGRYNTPAIEKAQMDAYYIRKASVLMDLRLILATVKVLFMKESSEGVVTESKTENRAENKAYKMIKERETA